MTWNAFSFSCILPNLQKFVVVSDYICTNDLSYIFLLKVMTGVNLNTFPNVLLILIYASAY